MQLDIDALFSTPSGVVKLFVFFALFLVVRGTPALLLYRHVLERRERVALALFASTQLPLVLAITTLAQETGHMERRSRFPGVQFMMATSGARPSVSGTKRKW